MSRPKGRHIGNCTGINPQNNIPDAAWPDLLASKPSAAAQSLHAILENTHTNHTLTLRSTLRPLLGRHTEGVIGDIVDAAALVGGVFGIATSLGVGVVQLNVALNILFGLPQGFPTQIGLTALAVVMATVSAVSGVDRGVRVLSTINVLLAIGLALWVLVTGDAAFLIDALIGSIGDFFTRFRS